MQRCCIVSEYVCPSPSLKIFSVEIIGLGAERQRQCDEVGKVLSDTLEMLYVAFAWDFLKRRNRICHPHFFNTYTPSTLLMS